MTPLRTPTASVLLVLIVSTLDDHPKGVHAREPVVLGEDIEARQLLCGEAHPEQVLTNILHRVVQLTS